MNDATRELIVAGMRLPLAGFVIDLGSEELRDAAGHSVRLRPQAWAVLRLLALKAGQLVTKDELLDAVWPGLVVTDSSLAQAISDVREALGGAGHRIIKTVPRRGYTLVADALSPATSIDDTSTGASATQDATGRPSVAVLAFRDPTEDATGQLLARALAQDLVLELARNADLRVISHHSSFALTGTDLSLVDIGRRLRARYLVDGTVRREGDILRIAIELIDSHSGQIVWVAHHRADSAAIPAVHDTLMRRIAGTLHSKAMYAAADPAALVHAPKSLDVYALCARAGALLIQFRPEGFREARALCERALAIDSQFPRAWALLASLNQNDASMLITGEWHAARAGEFMAQAQRALALDPGYSLAHRVMAMGFSSSRDFESALNTMRHAVALSPSNADNLCHLSKAQFELGMAEDALRNAELALDLHPLPPVWLNHHHGNALWANHRLTDALRAADDALAKLPHFWFARWLRVQTLVEMQRIDEAQSEAATLVSQVPELSAQLLLDRLSDTAIDLRRRRLDACLVAGIPRDGRRS